MKTYQEAVDIKMSGIAEDIRHHMNNGMSVFGAIRRVTKKSVFSRKLIIEKALPIALRGKE